MSGKSPVRFLSLEVQAPSLDNISIGMQPYLEGIDFVHVNPCLVILTLKLLSRLLFSLFIKPPVFFDSPSILSVIRNWEPQMLQVHSNLVSPSTQREALNETCVTLFVEVYFLKNSFAWFSIMSTGGLVMRQFETDLLNSYVDVYSLRREVAEHFSKIHFLH